MKQLIVAALAAALCAGPTFAQDKKEPKQPATEQEKRTAACSKQAADKGLKGCERSSS
jgi:hypothetical protein